MGWNFLDRNGDLKQQGLTLVGGSGTSSTDAIVLVDTAPPGLKSAQTEVLEWNFLDRSS